MSQTQKNSYWFGWGQLSFAWGLEWVANFRDIWARFHDRRAFQTLAHRNQHKPMPGDLFDYPAKSNTSHGRQRFQTEPWPAIPSASKLVKLQKTLSPFSRIQQSFLTDIRRDQKFRQENKHWWHYNVDWVNWRRQLGLWWKGRERGDFPQ